MKTAPAPIVTLFSLAVFALAAPLAACHHEEPATTPASKDATEQAGGHDEHAGLSAPVKAFHDEMAPLWHADKSPERTAKTCEHAPALQQKAAAVGDKDLLDATTALGAECAKSGRPDFEAKFAQVHEKFHQAEHAEHH